MPQSSSTDKIRIPQQGHRNQIPASRSQYQANTIRALDYQTIALPKLVKTGYRFLGHLPDRLGHTLRSLSPSSSRSTLPNLNHPRHRKMPSYGGLATYSAILWRFRTQDHNQNYNPDRNGVFICVYNRKAICLADRSELSHEYFQ
ncbi:hypothetical protein M9H77_08932 [Catharanthus roseus]|uniref:Uncharacterized protein n=1 Tax=Catharanthus roseus TaxID=4058 RepID=A0ACC0BZG3_CATRO|nr:hypothetical protein M9H77_08932 [Catharanthus roseus]